MQEQSDHELRTSRWSKGGVLFPLSESGWQVFTLCSPFLYYIISNNHLHIQIIKKAASCDQLFLVVGQVFLLAALSQWLFLYCHHIMVTLSGPSFVFRCIHFDKSGDVT